MQDSSNSNQSEVARLRQRIDEEYQAMQWALTGIACGVARHDFINKRYRQVDQREIQLTALLGQDEALSMIIEINDQYSPPLSPQTTS